VLVAYLLTLTSQNWTLTFYVSAAIYLAGALCWLFLDSHTPLERSGRPYQAVQPPSTNTALPVT